LSQTFKPLSIIVDGNRLLIATSWLSNQSVIPYGGQTAVSLLGHGPGDVFCIRDECLRLQSNVANGQDVSGPVSEQRDISLNIYYIFWLRHC